MNWNLIYDFLTGPALWFAFIFFIGGLFVRIAFLFRLSRKQDRVIYNHFSFSLTSSWDYALLILTVLPFLTGRLSVLRWGEGGALVPGSLPGFHDMNYK